MIAAMTYAASGGAGEGHANGGHDGGPECAERQRHAHQKRHPAQGLVDTLGNLRPDLGNLCSDFADPAFKRRALFGNLRPDLGNLCSDVRRSCLRRSRVRTSAISVLTSAILPSNAAPCSVIRLSSAAPCLIICFSRRPSASRRSAAVAAVLVNAAFTTETRARADLLSRPAASSSSMAWAVSMAAACSMGGIPSSPDIAGIKGARQSCPGSIQSGSCAP